MDIDTSAYPDLLTVKNKEMDIKQFSQPNTAFYDLLVTYDDLSVNISQAGSAIVTTIATLEEVVNKMKESQQDVQTP